METDSGIQWRERSGPVRPLADTDTESWGRARQGHGYPEWNLTREFNGGCVGPARPWADAGTKIEGARAGPQSS